MRHADINTRQSIFILITQLVALEAIISLMGYLIKFPLINGLFENVLVYTVITILVQAINILFILTILLRWVNTEYKIENGSLILRRGVISIKEKTYALDNVETVEIEQNWLARMIGFGIVKVYSPLFQERVDIWSIPNPEKFVVEMKRYIPTGSRVTVAPKI